MMNWKKTVQVEDLGVPHSQLDGLYGIDTTEDRYKIGKVSIKFKKDKVFVDIVDNVPFPRTSGSLELILYRNPQNYAINDLKPYKEILETSSVHRKAFKPNAQIKKHSLSNKFNNIIAPLFDLEPLNVTPKRKSPSKVAKKL